MARHLPRNGLNQPLLVSRRAGDGSSECHRNVTAFSRLLSLVSQGGMAMKVG